MSLTTRVLLGLAAGLLIGLALSGSSSPAAHAVLAVAAPVGTIFINLIRMTVIPLVASMLVASVGSVAGSGAFGRAGIRAAAVAVFLVVLAAVGTVLVAEPVLARITVEPAAALALRGQAAQGVAPSTPGAAQWFVDLVPQNVFKAAADGAMLPVILFALMFGIALARVTPTRRDAAGRAIQGVADAMQGLVAGILQLAPIGVFALAMPLASTLGVAAAGAVAAYLGLVVVLTLLLGLLVLYPLGILGGGMSASAFSTLCAPAQAVAFASRSSLAALPAMVESAERAGMSPVIAGFVLPLGASVFRVGAAVAMPAGVLFLARLYGVALSPAQLVSVVATTVLATFAVPGIPGGSVIAMVPVLAAANLPVAGIGILLAVDAIPDMFRTTANVTGSLTLAAVLRGRSN